MAKYILRRVLYFIPTLFVITLITFFLSIYAPGDPVEQLSRRGLMTGNVDPTEGAEVYLRIRKLLGLDLPVFYFTLSNLALSDTLHRIPDPVLRDQMKRMAYHSGNWKHVADFHNKLQQLDRSISLSTLPAEEKGTVRHNLYDLQHSKRESERELLLEDISLPMQHPSISNTIQEDHGALQSSYKTMQDSRSSWKKYIPVIYWNGFRNQYHRWLFGDVPWFSNKDVIGSRGVLRGDLGLSYRSRRPVSSAIADALPWTIILSLSSLLVAFAFAIPMGVFAARRQGLLADRATSTGLFMLYSLPDFWIGTMLIIFLGGGDYLDWFPTFGTSSLPDTSPWLSRLTDTLMHLVLPVFCLSYISFAFIARQMRGSMVFALRQDYVRTARAKGLNEHQVVWKHAFRNSLLPLITLLANVFPAIISGSFVIEYIFTIPGMGYLTYNALMARDHPIVFSVLLLTGILTLIGYLVSDLLYGIADPRIRIHQKQLSDDRG